MRTYPKRLLTVLVVLAMLVSMVTVPAMATDSSNTLTVGGENGLTLAEALTQAATMTGDVTVEIYGQVDFTNGMELNSGSYTSINFVGKDETAKMAIKQSSGGDYLEAHGKIVSFTDLILAKDPVEWANNSGHMGNYFSIQGGTITYNNCTFTQGACANTNTSTYNNCTFQHSSEYGLWVYDDALVTVNGGTIDSAKGIKVYAEDETTVTSTLTVQNATFTANVTKKPAVAIAYAASVSLIGNTYNNTSGILELDSGSDADCNGIPFVALDANGNDIAHLMTPVDRSNGNAYCGALMDGKIYTSVAAAHAEATTGSVITLLTDTDETIEFDGISLNRKGWESSGLTVKNPVAVTYSGEFVTLPDAIKTNYTGGPIELLADVTLSEMVTVTNSLILNGNGHTITGTAAKVFELYADASFDNVEIVNNRNSGRAIDLRAGGITVALSNNTSLVTSGTQAQALTVGGSGEGGTVTVNINGSTISAPKGYGIITFNPVNLTMTNASTSTGYGALYMKSANNSKGSVGSVVNIIDSTLSSSGEDFSTITLADNNITLNIDEDSTVEVASTGTKNQFLLSLYNAATESYVQNCKITINGTVTQSGENTIIIATNDLSNTIKFTHSDALYAQLKEEGYAPISDGTTITVYPVHAHELTKTDAVAATCTTAGNIEYYTCAICNGLFTDAEGETATTANQVVVPVDSSNHDLKLYGGTKANCKFGGYDEYYKCNDCGACFADAAGQVPAEEEDFYNPKLDHNLTFVKGTVTCTEDGSPDHYECSMCAGWWADEECTTSIGLPNRVVDATGHDLTPVAAKPATCTEDGVNAHYICSDCGKLFNDPAGLSSITQQQATAKATGHKAVMGVAGRLPTCTEPGNIEYVECSCGALFTDAECKNPVKEADTVVAATGHKLIKTAAVAATCTTAGNIEHYTCETCEGLFTDAEGKTATTAEKLVVAATGHKLTKIAAVAATCTTAGTAEHYACETCKSIFSDAAGKTATTAEKLVVAATGHKLTKVDAVVPTYTAGGNIEHYACANCKALFTDAEGKTPTTAEAVKLAQLIEIKESTAEVSSDAVDTAIKEAETTGSITIDLVEVAESETTTPDSGSDSTTPDSGSDTTTKPAPVVSSAALPVASLEKVAEISEEATLTVNMTEVTVTIDAKAMAAVAEQSAAETVTLKVEKVETETLTEKQQAVIEDKEVAVVVTATMISNNTAISDFKGGSVTIAIPFTLPEGTEGSDFQVYYVADDGTMTAHDTEYKNGCLVFSTTHFSDYVVVNTAEPADPNVPNTGDNADLLLHTSILMIALVGLSVLFINKKKFSF